MQCTKCYVHKPLCDFSFKNIKEEIYYLYCDECRIKISNIQNKYRENAKLGYEIKKLTEYIECNCGKKFICFRNYHMERHINSKFHQKYIK